MEALIYHPGNIDSYAVRMSLTERRQEDGYTSLIFPFPAQEENVWTRRLAASRWSWAVDCDARADVRGYVQPRRRLTSLWGQTVRERLDMGEKCVMAITIVDGEKSKVNWLIRSSYV